MNGDDVLGRVERAVLQLVKDDRYLLENDLSERCIASRLAMYLQQEFREYDVDVEFNRQGGEPKLLTLPEECGSRRDAEGRALVIPDVIVHRRGADGPNVLVIEVKKTTNPTPRGCDERRIDAFRRHFGYAFGALIECETRHGRPAAVTITEWKH